MNALSPLESKSLTARRALSLNAIHIGDIQIAFDLDSPAVDADEIPADDMAVRLDARHF